MATSIAVPGVGGSGGSGGGGDVSGGGGGSDLFTELGEIINSAVPEGDGGEGSDVQQQADTAPVIDAELVDDQPEGQTQELATTGNEPYPVSEDGKNYLVPRDQMPEITGLREYSTKVQERFPTIQDAELAHILSTDLRSMQYDYASGNPENVDRMLQFWMGANAQDPRMRQRYESAFAVMAQRVPQFLQKINPEAHTQLAKSMSQPFIAKAYEKAAMERDPETQKALFRAAQGVDYSINGTYKTELPAYDPNVEASKAAQAAEQNRARDLEARETRMIDQALKAFDQQTLTGARNREVAAAIDDVLKTVRNKYDDSEYSELHKSVLNELTSKLTADRDWWNTHAQELADLQNEFKHCWKTGQDPAVLNQRIQYFKNDLLVRARRLLPSIAAPRISKATERKVIAAQPKNATAQQKTQAPNGRPLAPAPEKNGNQHYSIHDDPEFKSMFKFA